VTGKGRGQLLDPQSSAQSGQAKRNEGGADTNGGLGSDNGTSVQDLLFMRMIEQLLVANCILVVPYCSTYRGYRLILVIGQAAH